MRKATKNEGAVFDETGAELAIRDTDLATANPLLVLHTNRPPIDNIKLIQGTSASGTPGTFMNTETGESFEELNAIPFRIQANRVLWPKDFDRSRDPDCASHDGRVAVAAYPNGGLPRYPGRECGEYEHNVMPWEAPEGIEPCRAGYQVLLFDVVSSSIFRMRLAGTGLKLVERLLARPHVFQKQVVRLIAVRQNNEKGSWWQAVGTATGEITDEQRLDIVSLAQSFLPAESY